MSKHEAGAEDGSVATRAKAYATLAWLIAVVGVGALAGATWYYRRVLHVVDGQALSLSSSDWGTFGDFVGGIAGTVIAGCTLVALAITMHLQARELEATRRELGRQTRAATSQLEYEARRLRPFIKTEWFHEDTHRLAWYVKNVGLGPCILDRIELQKRNGDSLGGFHASADPGALAAWQFAFSNTWSDEGYGYKPKHIEVLPLHDFKRVLGPNETQKTVGLVFEDKGPRNRAFERLETDDWVRAVVHYRSIDGQSFSTLTQLQTFGENEEVARE